MSAESTVLKQYRSPGTAIGRFVARRTAKSAAFWALGFGAYVASKIVGFAAAYPNAQARAAIATTFGNNVGLDAILGRPRDMWEVAGVGAWNTLGVMVLVGSIWSFLLATRYFRGEEENGRSELLLTGQTTMARSALNTLLGITASIGILFVITAAAFVLVGQVHSVDYSVSAGIFFALAVAMGMLVFAYIGAFASQLMPTRARAATFSAITLGIFFLLRAMADSTNATWPANFTPLGWVENLRPLYDSKPLWLIPLALFAALVAGMTVWLAGRRDLGESVYADKDSARPKYGFLNTPLGSAIRLTRAKTIGWLLGAIAIGYAFGKLTQSVVSALGASSSTVTVLDRLAQTKAQNVIVTGFLGAAFLLIMVILMCYVASAVGAVRDTEGQGYLDNLLVRAVGRTQWLSGRTILIAGSVVIAVACGTAAIWAGMLGENFGISLKTICEAGANMLAAPLFTLGFGVLVFGVMPRLTTILTYSVIAWSFLLDMVSSGLHLNHWLLDTSVFYHITLAPAVNPRWSSAIVLIGLGCLGVAIGMWRFHTRDLQSE